MKQHSSNCYGWYKSPENTNWRPCFCQTLGLCSNTTNSHLVSKQNGNNEENPCSLWNVFQSHAQKVQNISEHCVIITQIFLFETHTQTWSLYLLSLSAHLPGTVCPRGVQVDQTLRKTVLSHAPYTVTTILSATVSNEVARIRLVPTHWTWGLTNDPKRMVQYGSSCCVVKVILVLGFWSSHPPAVSTDAVYLYLLNSRYSLMSSLIRRFSWESGGRGSRCSSRALNTSALMRAFSWLRTPRDSSVSLTARRFTFHPIILTCT